MYAELVTPGKYHVHVTQYQVTLCQCGHIMGYMFYGIYMYMYMYSVVCAVVTIVSFSAIDCKELAPFDFQCKPQKVVNIILVLFVAQVLLFIKYYDPFTKTLSFIGHVTEEISLKFGN